jgi:hypothetical protein
LSSLVLLLKSAWDGLRELFFKEGLGQALSWLFRGSPLVLRVTTLFFLVLSLLLGTVVSLNIAKTNAIVVRALSSPIEATPHPNSAIEALLLSSILVEPDGADNAGSKNVGQQARPKVSDAFKADLAVLEEILAAGPTAGVVNTTSALLNPA